MAQSITPRQPFASSPLDLQGVTVLLTPEACVSLTPLPPWHVDDIGCAEGVEAVHEFDADGYSGGLAVRVSRHDALAEGLALWQRSFASIRLLHQIHYAAFIFGILRN